MFKLLVLSAVVVTVAYSGGYDSGSGSNCFGSQSAQERLAKDLLHSYDSSVSPWIDYSRPLDVTISLIAYDANIPDADDGTVQISGYLVLSWVDHRLQWNPADYGGLTEINVAYDKLWIPNIKRTNHVYRYEQVPTFTSNNFHYPSVDYTGRVAFQPKIAHRVNCKHDNSYGADKYVCPYTFEAWDYNAKKIALHDGYQPIVQFGIESNQLSLVDSKVEARDFKYTYEKIPYSQVTYTLTFQKPASTQAAYQGWSARSDDAKEITDADS